MKHAATKQLYAYWNSLRGERASPERGEVDPAAIRGILADTFILESDASRRFTFRLSGTRLNALFTGDLKGRGFSQLWARADRGDIDEVLAAVCDEAAPVVAGVSAAPTGREPVRLELLLLPVRHLGKTHARILGCLSPGALPNWIGLLPVEHLSLTGLRILSPDADAAAPPFGHAAERAGCPKPAGQRHGHLVVHEGGR